MFEVRDERIETPALRLRFHVTPWDRAAFGAETAAIAGIELHDRIAAAADFAAFRRWCRDRDICLVTCRLPQTRLDAVGFLEAQGFRFIELNYRPVLRNLTGFSADPAIAIVAADAADRAAVAGIAARIFAAGRLQVDPDIDSTIGDRRYAIWAANAFDHPHQSVLKCLLHGEVAAFMVIEAPKPHTRFWSLVGLAPGLAGRGLGRRIWGSVLAAHHAEGVAEVSTSISSHNTAVHNLYAGMGFRFPAPDVTLHWCPDGPVHDRLAGGR